MTTKIKQDTHSIDIQSLQFLSLWEIITDIIHDSGPLSVFSLSLSEHGTMSVPSRQVGCICQQSFICVVNSIDRDFKEVLIFDQE